MRSTTHITKNYAQRTLTVERIVRIPRKLAWQGWTIPKHIERWWGPRLWSATVYEMDVRPGGVWRYSLRPDDQGSEEAFCRAVYNEVMEPAKLVYTDSFADREWDVVEGSDMRTTVQFDEVYEGTRLSIITEFATIQDLEAAEATGMIEGFSDAFERLENYLGTLQGGTMNRIRSQDGTQIAYKKRGDGPAVILVSSAASDHHDAEQLAELLARQFTVFNYDRRGRGHSTDHTEYAVEREIEDINAVIQEAGGSACLFGSSSGAVLALEAASKLGDRVSKLFLYEPPFIVNESRPRVPADYVQQLDQFIEQGKRSEAVEYFMTAAVSIPAEYVEFMKSDPSWTSMAAIAHTLAYDGQVMGETQSGNPLPTGRWKVKVPTMVMTGEQSAPFFRDGAEALVNLLEQANHHILPGQDHSAVMMAPDVLADAVSSFFGSPVPNS